MEKKVDFKGMPLKKKIGYIWDYYRWFIVAGVAIIGIVSSILYDVFTYVDPLINVIMFNYVSEDMDKDRHEGFTEFVAQQGCDYDVEDAVLLSSNIIFSDTDEYGTNYQYATAVNAMVQTAEYEILIGEGDAYLGYTELDILSNLNNYLSEDLLEKYEDSIIYSTNGGEVDPYPCAIELTDNEWMRNNGYPTGGYIGLIDFCDNYEIGTAFIEYVLNY